MMNPFRKKEDPAMKMLAAMLSTEQGRSNFLLFGNAYKPTPEQEQRDSIGVLNHVDTDEYKAWAKKAWSKVLVHIDGILASKSNEQTNFERGALRATLDLLAVSYTAKFKQEKREASTAPLRPKN